MAGVSPGVSPHLVVPDGSGAVENAAACVSDPARANLRRTPGLDTSGRPWGDPAGAGELGVNVQPGAFVGHAVSVSARLRVQSEGVSGETNKHQ